MEVTTGVREEDGKTRVTVELSPEEVKGHVDAFFKQLSKSRIPGFRPGRAPRKVLEQNFGGHAAVYAQITADTVDEVAPLAVDQQDIIFLTDPEFDEDRPSVEDGKPYTFNVYGVVKPTVTLTSYDPVEIEMPDSSASDDEVEEQIETLRGYYYDIRDVERPAEKKDYIEVTIKATLDGEDVPSISCKGRLIELSSPALPASVNEQLIGMSTGEKKEFDALIDEEETYVSLKGKVVHIDATCENVRTKVLPPLDDAFAQQLGFDSMDVMREQVHNQIEYQKGADLPELKERRCITALSERVEQDEFGEEYVAHMRQDILREFFNRLQQSDTTFDKYLANQGITSDDFQKDLDEQAVESARESLALDALFDHVGLELTDEEIDEEFESVGRDDVTREQWEADGRLSEVREAMRRQKASKWLTDNAVVTLEEPEDEEAEGDEKADEKAEDKTGEKADEKPAAKKAASKKSTAKKPAAKKSTAKKSTAKKSAAERTGAEKAAAEKADEGKAEAEEKADEKDSSAE